LYIGELWVEPAINTLLWFHQSTQLLPSGKVTLTDEVLVCMHGSHQDVLAQQIVESGWLEDVYQILSKKSPFTHLNIASNKVSSSVERTAKLQHHQHEHDSQQRVAEFVEVPMSSKIPARPMPYSPLTNQHSRLHCMHSDKQLAHARPKVTVGQA